jgi:broad specificity phosphatase PhoE
VNKFWKTEIVEQKIPTPQRYYTSPLTRCLPTANLTFFGLDLVAFHPFVPEVKELLRETISGHTCDRRGSKTYIHTAFPTYTFEDGLADSDTLWEALHGETDADQDIRSKEVLDDIFLSDSSTYISITGRSDEITSLLRE